MGTPAPPGPDLDERNRLPQQAARAAMVRLRLAMEDGKGWSQSELARRVAPQTTPTQIRKLENGDLNISLDWMERLARAFGVTMSAFLPPQEVALHVDPATSEMLEIARELPPHERPMMARAAIEVMTLARRLGGTESGFTLRGSPILAEKLAARWNGWSEPQRQKVADLLEAAESIAGS